MLKMLHHNAYRCRDSEETRRFYEDFLGLPLIHSKPIVETLTGREVRVLHTFYRMGDGSFLAFFDVVGDPFEFKVQKDYDLHIALEVEPEHLQKTLERAKAAGMEARGISDHGFIDSIYLRDPNGYVIELTARRPDHDEQLVGAEKEAHAVMEAWLAENKAPAAKAG